MGCLLSGSEPVALAIVTSPAAQCVVGTSRTTTRMLSTGASTAADAAWVRRADQRAELLRRTALNEGHFDQGHVVRPLQR